MPNISKSRQLADFVHLNAIDASELDQGAVVLATLEEALAGIDAEKVITPATLKATIDALGTPDATKLARGIIQIATQVEVNAGTDQDKTVSPASLQANLAQHTSINALTLAGEASDFYSPQSDTYTKNEVDNAISGVVSDLDWKEGVATFGDLATTYSAAQEGWTASVDDVDIIYRFDGTDWLVLAGGTIPLATDSVDGKMSASDFTKLAGLANYTHPTGDGNNHVPANGTDSVGKVLTSSAIAGTYIWEVPVPGAVGTQFFSGTTAPTEKPDGTFWLDTDDEVLYQQQSSSWVQISAAVVGTDLKADVTYVDAQDELRALKTNAVFVGSLTEGYAAITGVTPALSATAGTLQSWVLTNNSTPTDSFADNTSITLMIDDGSDYSVTWPSVNWKTEGGVAPTLNATEPTFVVLWKVAGDLFGSRVGDA